MPSTRRRARTLNASRGSAPEKHGVDGRWRAVPNAQDLDFSYTDALEKGVPSGVCVVLLDPELCEAMHAAPIASPM